ncbi:MAG: sensor histidine kinase [Clostridia bacterium]
MQRNLQGIQVGKGDVVQVKADNNGSLFAVSTSTITGWTICVEIPMDVLTNSMRNLIVINTLVSILIVTLFGLILFRYISRITNDIVCVANAMQVVEENNFSLRLHSNRKDEIGLIYVGFNTMAENLGKYFAEGYAGGEKQK